MRHLHCAQCLDYSGRGYGPHDYDKYSSGHNRASTMYFFLSYSQVEYNLTHAVTSISRLSFYDSLSRGSSLIVSFNVSNVSVQ
jgi:hypothetical protein